MGKVFDSGPVFNTYWREYEEFCKGKGVGPYTLEGHDAWREKMKNSGIPPRLSVVERKINRMKRDVDEDFQGKRAEE